MSGFGGLVKAELRKLFTTRAWWGMLIGVVVVSAGFALLIALIAGRNSTNGGGNGGLGKVTDPATVRQIYTAGIGISYLFSLAAGILGMAGEYRHQTISATFLASPHRVRVLLAKIVALLGLGAMYGVASVIAGVLAGAPTIAARGGSVRLLSDGVPRSLVLGILAVALWSLFGLGLATVIRNQVAALMISIGVAWIVVPLVSVLLDAVHWDTVAAYLPSQATSAMLSTATSSSSGDTLAWWGGALVMIAYAALFSALGTALTLRRDVT